MRATFFLASQAEAWVGSVSLQKTKSSGKARPMLAAESLAGVRRERAGAWVLLDGFHCRWYKHKKVHIHLALTTYREEREKMKALNAYKMLRSSNEEAPMERGEAY